jgi:hypothetical protein
MLGIFSLRIKVLLKIGTRRSQVRLPADRDLLDCTSEAMGDEPQHAQLPALFTVTVETHLAKSVALKAPNKDGLCIYTHFPPR